MTYNKWVILDDDSIPEHYINVSSVDRRLVDTIDIDKKKVLNVGSGCYHITDEFMLKKGAYVVSLDMNNKFNRIMSSRINKNCPDLFSRFVSVNGDACNLPFPDNHFDVTVSFSALEHIPKTSDRIKAFNEMSRVLKNGGYMVITLPNKLFVPATILSGIFKKRSGEYEHRYTPKQLKDIMESNGIDIIRFDSQMPCVIDDYVFNDRLPFFFKKIGIIKEASEVIFSLMNNKPFKKIGARMGYVGIKR